MQRAAHYRAFPTLVFLSFLVLFASCSDNQDPDIITPPEGNSGDETQPVSDFEDKYEDVDGDGLFHHGEDCLVCHDLRQAGPNLSLIPQTVTTTNSGDRAVVFTAREGANSFADGDAVFDGICEICHTSTTYHRNDASGDQTHYTASKCVDCHTHRSEFAPGGGGPGHDMHTGDSGVGPNLACDYCHFTDLSSFVDGEPFATTAVCNDCHSPDGMIDGVDDPDVGARTNWDEGVYVDGLLAAGKENWCSGCHDLGSSVVESVPAPPVSGNETWGFNASGHGIDGAIVCTDCHDTSLPHVDGLARTYTSVENNYRVGYRLSLVDGEEPMDVPRLPEEGWAGTDPYLDPPLWDLCFTCHDKYALFGSPTAPGLYNTANMQTNFRNDASLIIPDGYDTDIAQYSVGGATLKNSHYTHNGGPPHSYDTDFDGVNESFGTCIACHNVHGSSYPSMIRDGILIGHEPSLNFSHVKYDSQYPPVPTWSIMTSEDVTATESLGAAMRANSGPTVNGVCSFCHAGGANTPDPWYTINCYGPKAMCYYRTWVTTPTPESP